MDDVDEGAGGSGSSGYGAATTETTTTTEGSKTEGNSGDGAGANPPAAQAAGAPNEKTESADQSKPETTPAGSGVSGYGKTEEKTDDKSKTDDKPLELDLKGLKEEQVADVRATAKELGLTKDQAQKLVEKRNADLKAQSDAQVAKQTEIKTVHAAWEKELRDDKDFGGANFDSSLHAVDKIIDDHLPSLKKVLTDTKGRVPPGIMKELKVIATKLYGETTFKTGGSAAATVEHNPLDFYNKKK